MSTVSVPVAEVAPVSAVRAARIEAVAELAAPWATIAEATRGYSPLCPLTVNWGTFPEATEAESTSAVRR